jgi:hypothetical protein
LAEDAPLGNEEVATLLRDFGDRRRLDGKLERAFV